MAAKYPEAIVVGGGLAGLSAAIYLARAKRRVLVIDSGKSMARWEPEVQNYLGFPEGIGGEELLQRARTQARKYHAQFVRDEIVSARRIGDGFSLRGKKRSYRCLRLLLATGIFHIPPDIPDVAPCLGHSMFFCKDCDGYRVQGKRVAIYGWTNETAEYALAMLAYSPHLSIVTDGRVPRWDRKHSHWLREYEIPVYRRSIHHIKRRNSEIRVLEFDDRSVVKLNALFTTRGDICFNKLAKGLGAKLDDDGQIIVNINMRTSVPGLFAAGCVTPANCQMIIAAGQGATAAQNINHDLFERSLRNHSLRRAHLHRARKRHAASAGRQPA
jgi:thioredoxin reductase (NADPH)